MEPVSTLLYSFILVLARPFGFVSSFFFIGGELVPTWPRRGLILAFALPVFPIVFDAAPNIAAQDFLWLTILQEFALGWLIGWPVMGVGVAWSSAGFLIDNQRGSSLAGQFDPGLATESSPLSNFLNLAWVVVLVQGGLFQALAQLLYSSYSLAPVGEVSKIVLMERMHEFIMVFAAITKAAFLLASPAIITLSLIHI